MKILKDGTITSPKGYLASVAKCGIKKSGRNDAALLYSKKKALCAGMFTSNRVKSGSVVLSKSRIENSIAQAIFVNSGNANCCVGKREIVDAKAITSLVAEELGIEKEDVLIASTGIIGRPLPLDKILKKVGILAGSLGSLKGRDFAKAIVTTDTFHKEIAVEDKIGNKVVTIAGAAKGAGMICPNMATMLAFFTTDAAIEKKLLKEAFKECIGNSFNRITIDGDMSTNDTAIIFANGLAGNRLIRTKGPDYLKFLKALNFVCTELAKKIVLDGEGATRFIEVLVKGAKDKKSADIIARHVSDSKLIKTMIAGGDPNWGRVAASAGSSGVNIDKEKLDIYFGNTCVMKNGAATNSSREKLLKIFEKKHIVITIDLKVGTGAAKLWTCDLTEEYVRINAEYET